MACLLCLPHLLKRDMSTVELVWPYDPQKGSLENRVRYKKTLWLQRQLRLIFNRANLHVNRWITLEEKLWVPCPIFLSSTHSGMVQPCFFQNALVHKSSKIFLCITVHLRGHGSRGHKIHVAKMAMKGASSFFHNPCQITKSIHGLLLL